MNDETHLVPFDPFKMMDLLDDEAIVAEIEGRISDKWVYHFPGGQGEKEIWGISKDGTDQACVMLSKEGHIIREDDVKYDLCPVDKEYVNFTAFASLVAVSRDGQEVNLSRVTGAKRQWTKQLLKNGNIKKDQFWFEKGMMKAIRNARQRLIPEEIKAKIIALAKEKGKVKTVESPAKETKPKAEKTERSYKNYYRLITEMELDAKEVDAWVHETYLVASKNDIPDEKWRDFTSVLENNPAKVLDSIAKWRLKAQSQPTTQATMPGTEG